MPCKGTEDCPNVCCVHPEHAFAMHSQNFHIPTTGFKTALEQFDLDKKDDNMANEFSEINLHLAVHDDTEKKLPAIPPAPSRTVRLSLREMLKDGKFKSPSRAIVNKTVKQIHDERRAKENARKRALMERLKMKTHARVKLNRITKYMANLAIEEQENKLRERRLEMGLPPDMKFKSALAKVRAINTLQTAVISTPLKADCDPVKLPKIVKTTSEEVKNRIETTHERVSICSSYGGFLSDEVGRSGHTVNLPFIKSVNGETLEAVPSRPAYFNKEKKIKVPAHLERFRYMRIKN